MEHPKVTVGVTGPKTGLFPYITVAFYGGTSRTAAGDNCRIHASMSSSPPLPRAGEDERSIAALVLYISNVMYYFQKLGYVH